MLARIAENGRASEIASSVDISQAIQWVAQSWNEVSLESIEACINEYLSERKVELLSSDDDNDENCIAEGSETIEPAVSYSEALVLFDELAYVDGMSLEGINILFLLHEKIKKLTIQSKKQSSIKIFFSSKLKQLSVCLE